MDLPSLSSSAPGDCARAGAGGVFGYHDCAGGFGGAHAGAGNSGRFGTAFGGGGNSTHGGSFAVHGGPHGLGGTSTFGGANPTFPLKYTFPPNINPQIHSQVVTKAVDRGYLLRDGATVAGTGNNAIANYGATHALLFNELVAPGSATTQNHNMNGLYDFRTMDQYENGPERDHRVHGYQPNLTNQPPPLINHPPSRNSMPPPPEVAHNLNASVARTPPARDAPMAQAQAQIHDATLVNVPVGVVRVDDHQEQLETMSVLTSNTRATNNRGNDFKDEVEEFRLKATSHSDALVKFNQKFACLLNGQLSFNSSHLRRGRPISFKMHGVTVSVDATYKNAYCSCQSGSCDAAKQSPICRMYLTNEVHNGMKSCHILGMISKTDLLAHFIKKPTGQDLPLSTN